MTNEIRRRRGLNYLGELGSKLRDLRGTATLAHELIQNAEDAIKDVCDPSMQAATISFRIDQRALIVDNGGVFSDCGHQDESVCPWKSEEHRPCDFHSFAEVGGAEKRRASAERGASGGLKGAFGFGFTAVYQVTDHPQLISNGRHWILEDHKPEDQRILECNQPNCEYCSAADLPGTRFVLPWAFDETSEVRRGLNAPSVSAEKPQELVHELQAALPRTILFLDHLRQLRVFWKHTETMRVTVSERSDPVITVSTNGETTPWALLTYDFADIARSLRSQHPEGEKYPSSEVKVAIPQGGLNDGLFFAYLPTQMQTDVPFHINADFFPSNDRKRLLLEDDYQGAWNRAAIRAGAIALRDGLLSLRSHLGPNGFWNLVHRVREVAERESLLGIDYWIDILPVLKEQKVIPGSDGTWYSARSIRFVSRDNQERFHELYAELCVCTVDPTVEDHGDLLTSADIGVKHLDLATVARQLVIMGLVSDRSLEQFPIWFQESGHRELLWQQIGHLLNRESDSQLPDADNSGSTLLAECSVVECNDGRFRTIATTFKADCQTVELFQPLCPELHFAGQNAEMLGAIGRLIPQFSVADAIEALTNRQAIQDQMGDEGQGAIPDDIVDICLAWFNERIVDLEEMPSLVAKLKSLSICPTHDGLQPFNSVVLPGGFSDPIGVTSVAIQESLKSITPLVRLLQLDPLSLSDYVIDRLPDAFDKWHFDADKCRELLTMLSQHQGQLFDCDTKAEIRSTLSDLEFIPCADGVLRCVNDGLYFPEQLTERVLGNSVAYVAESVCTSGITTLLKWLGVESRPRLDRVVDYLIETAHSESTPSPQLVERVLALFEHLGSRMKELETDDRLLDKLKSNEWLPSSTRRWDADARLWRSSELQWAAPRDLHHQKCRHLVEAVAPFVRLPNKAQIEHRRLLHVLGVVDRPSAKTVLKHLRESANVGSPVDPRVYDFLNTALKEGELYPADFRSLATSPCLYRPDSSRFVRPSECFSEDHPFNTHRVLIGAADRTTLKELLTALGIRRQPTWNDAVEVLREIAQTDDVLLKRGVSRDDRRVVMACWKLIEYSLKNETAHTESICSDLEDLSKLPVVCREDNLLDKPAHVFFGDRQHLAEAFADSLNAELIRMPQGATVALTQAGVRRLSEVTEIRVRHDDADQTEALYVATRIKERAELLANVIETCQSARQHSSLPDFTDLRVLEAHTLTVDLIFNGFAKPLPPVTHTVLAIVESSPATLWYCLEDGVPPWDTIACELARLCLQSDDVAQVSAAINAAIEPVTLQRAQRKLSQLGFPSIEVCDEATGATDASPTFGSQGRDSLEEPLHTEVPDANPPSTGNTGDSVSSVRSESDMAVLSPDLSTGSRPTASNAKVAENHQPVSGRSLDAAGNNRLQSGPQQCSIDTASASDVGERFSEWLAAQPGATDRRRKKILETSSEADRRRSEYGQRMQRVNQIPVEEVLLYLNAFYSRDDRIRCQMMKEGDPDLHEMPFWKSTDQMYSGKEELFNRQMTQLLPYALPESKELNLSLCPNCAALYTKFVATKMEQQLRLFNWVRSNAVGTTFNLDCSLSGKQPNRVLHFHPKHLDDIRSVDGVFDASSAAGLEGERLTRSD